MSVTLTSTVRDEAVNHKSQVVQLKSSSCLLRLVILTGLSVFWEELFLFLFHQTVREKESKHINIMHQHILSDPPKKIYAILYLLLLQLKHFLYMLLILPEARTTMKKYREDQIRDSDLVLSLWEDVVSDKCNRLGDECMSFSHFLVQNLFSFWH